MKWEWTGREEVPLAMAMIMIKYMLCSYHVELSVGLEGREAGDVSVVHSR